MAGKLIKLNLTARQINNIDVIDYWRCETCGTDYPEMFIVQRDFLKGYTYERGIRCNGQFITKCPYCSKKE